MKKIALFSVLAALLLAPAIVLLLPGEALADDNLQRVDCPVDGNYSCEPGGIMVPLELTVDVAGGVGFTIQIPGGIEQYYDLETVDGCSIGDCTAPPHPVSGTSFGYDIAWYLVLEPPAPPLFYVAVIDYTHYENGNPVGGGTTTTTILYTGRDPHQ